MPVGGTPKSATAVAALAADANNESALDLNDDDIMGGQGLVEAVFSGMFEEEFDGVMPIRDHKVSLKSRSGHPLQDLQRMLGCDMLILAVFGELDIIQQDSRQVMRGGLPPCSPWTACWINGTRPTAAWEMAEARLAQAKDGKRPTHRLGCCGCRGEAGQQRPVSRRLASMRSLQALGLLASWQASQWCRAAMAISLPSL